jgi:hypothetical protein
MYGGESIHAQAPKLCTGLGFLKIAIAQLSLQPAHAQRLQTYVGEARLPVLPLSAPNGATGHP